MNLPHDPSLDGLPHWATITQVSAALLVPRTTVRGAVRRALAEGEPWVMRADADDEHSPYLIDTLHPTCLAHVKRWTQKEATPEEEEEPDELEDDWSIKDPFSFTHHYRAQPSPFSPPVSRRSGEEVLQLWPLLRGRLYLWGIQIFQNILAADIDDWQWRWGELHGEGYESEEEAIVAALQSRLAGPEDANPISPTPPVPLFPPPTRRASLEQVPDQPFWFFPRRRRRRFFS